MTECGIKEAQMIWAEQQILQPMTIQSTDAATVEDLERKR